MLFFTCRAVRPAIVNTLFRNNVTPPSIASASLSNNSKTPDADLVVVGAGVAGVCASIAAAEKGASVVLVDAGHGGGASALSGGVVYAGGGTTQQKAAGYGHDTPEDMYAYLKEETSDAVDEETLRRFCNTSAESLQWLEKHGAKFEASLCPYKTSYPTDQHYLYFSGSEKSHPYNKIAKPAPRGHRTVHPGMSGSELWRVLFKSAMGLGVRFIPSSKITKVLFDAQNRVNGIEVKTLPSSNPSFPRHEKLVKKEMQYQLRLPPLAKWYHDRATQIWTRDSQLQKLHAPSVVLACGGFTFNQEMRQKYMPQFSRVGPLGTSGDDGSGIAVGQSAGGSVAKLNRMSAWCFIYPPTALVEGVVVSSQGHRMISEDVYGAALTETMVLEHNSTGFLILDQDQWTKAKKQVFEQTQSPILLQRLHWLYWSHKKAESLGALAAKLGIAKVGLEETISAYNHAIATDSEDPMHKMPEYRSPILKPPFYGIDLSVKGTGVQPVLGLTLGGLRVDGRTGLVLAGNDTKINGLYAAGRTAVGVCANSYVSGLSIADCVFSGQRAGEDAASKMTLKE